MTRLASTFLFVPATRSDRIVKAAASDADEVIVDLEDAVAASEKDVARSGLRSIEPLRRLLIRVNARGTPEFAADLAAVADLPWVGGVVMPKVELADDIDEARATLGTDVPLFALIESARGIQNLDVVAAAAVERLIFGSIDYLAEIGAESSDAVLGYPRSRLVVASAASGLPPPLDGPTLALSDKEAVRTDATTARSLGFGGKVCIHPAQLAVVKEVFAPTAEQIAWARRVVEANECHQGGVVTVDGRMVDAPVVARARRLLAADAASG